MITDPATAVASNKAVIRRVFDEILNRGNLDLIDELYLPEMIDHDPLPGAPEGLEGVRYTISGLRTAFPDLRATIDDISAHRDKVVIHSTWRGTHLGDLVGLPPTGRPVEYSGIVVWRLQDGRIAERWAMTDILQKFGIAERRSRRVRATGFLDESNSVVPYVSAQLILPEKFDVWMRFHEELRGPRHEEFLASRRRLGITREVAWKLAYPRAGDVEIEVVYWETRDLVKAFKGLATSEEPFDVWFRQKLTEMHGFELNDVVGLGPSQVIFEWSDR